MKGFETAIEKIGRILASQYNIKVLFEGNQAKTDGETIVLPFIQDMSKELYKDLNGYLDHEVAHCKFTDFNAVKKVDNKFLFNISNVAEDIRIERLMKEEFPGTIYNLEPLRDKVRASNEEHWDKAPWPVKFLFQLQDQMQNLPDGLHLKEDPETKDHLHNCREEIERLNNCKNTSEIIELSKIIYEKVMEEEAKKEKEKGESDDDSEGEKSDPKDGETGGSDKSSEKKSKPIPGMMPEDGEDSESDSDSESSESTSSESKVSKMLKAKEGSKSEWDKHIISVHDLMDEKIEKEVKDKPKDPITPTWNDTPSIPTTTRFDKVTDHSGKGNYKTYTRLKREIQPMVSPIKQELERALKVQEDARWRPERERGKIDSRGLSKLVSSPGYRTIFKDFTKTDTTNIAIQILVDLSGSMYRRINTARLTTIAMSEALKSLNINFEVTGFNSIHSDEMARFSKEILKETRTRRRSGRFNRVQERLDHHVYKSFDSSSLSGIETMVHGHNNTDGESVIWAAKRLALRKEKRKILLVLSDGEPADAGDISILSSDLKNKVIAINKSGIECIGIGIETNAVKHYYPDYVVLDRLEDLPKAAMRKLSKLITKGMR